MCSLTAVAQHTLLAAGQPYTAVFSPVPFVTGDAMPQPAFSVDTSEAAVGLAPLAPEVTLSDRPSSDVCTQIAEVTATGAHSSDYAFNRAQFSSAALKAAFSHDNMVKMAHDFMPGQPLPDAPGYHPLTTKQKFEAFLRNSYSPGMTVNILSDALVSQATGAYPRLNPGWPGFGERMGISAMGAESAAFIGGFVYPTLFHQDPRYFPSHEHGIMNRIAYAASRAFIGRSDDGRSVINTSVIASQFTEAAIANAYVPYRSRSASGTIENALTGLGGVAEGHILDEFWPDIKEFVWRRTHSDWIRRGMELGDPTGQQAFR